MRHWWRIFASVNGLERLLVAIWMIVMDRMWNFIVRHLSHSLFKRVFTRHMRTGGSHGESSTPFFVLLSLFEFWKVNERKFEEKFLLANNLKYLLLERTPSSFRSFFVYFRLPVNKSMLPFRTFFSSIMWFDLTESLKFPFSPLTAPRSSSCLWACFIIDFGDERIIFDCHSVMFIIASRWILFDTSKGRMKAWKTSPAVLVDH